MKKIFHKLNKIMLIAGIAALIILVLIIANASDTGINDMWGIPVLICFGVMFLVAVFIIISAVLEIIDGLKKDKVAFIKSFLVTLLGVATAYSVIYGVDYFRESYISKEFELGKFLFRILLSTIAIIGGKYMFKGHNKEENDM